MSWFRRIAGKRTDRSGWTLRMVFLFLLLVALAQVLWWVFDQDRLMDEVTGELRTSSELQRRAAERLLEEGASAGEVEGLFPDLEVEGDRVAIADERLADLAERRRSHLNQYRWEGAFFLAVLLAGMVVLARAMAREVELRRRQENFLAAVTHELKSPLASLRLDLETAVRRELDEGRRRQLTERSLLDVARLEGLVDNVLASSRVDAGVLGRDLEPVALARAVDEVVGTLVKIEQIGADVVNDVPRDLAVLADEVGVRTVLFNLLDNALEASRHVDEPWVSLEAGAVAGGRIRLVVEDNGSGFDPAEAERLFGKFYRPGDELTRKRAGSGLGLFLVRRFVESVGGRVEAESPGPGKGARFTVEWPSAS